MTEVLGPDAGKLTDKQLANWQAWDQDPDLALWEHFEAQDVQHWADVYREGVRVFSAMFEDGDPIEDYSPMSAVFSAVAVTSAYGAFEAVAAALGVKAEDLRAAVEKWYEFDNAASPVGFEGLAKLLSDEQGA